MTRQGLDYCDRMDAKRCVVDGCGSGLGVPVIGDEYLRRCVHCGEDLLRRRMGVDEMEYVRHYGNIAMRCSTRRFA